MTFLQDDSTPEADTPPHFAHANGVRLCYDSFGAATDPPLLGSSSFRVEPNTQNSWS